jgi:hypothetical protein
VVSTGRQPGLFPEVATTLVGSREPPEYLPLNDVILKACQPAPADRYATAAELGGALAAGLQAMDQGGPPPGRGLNPNLDKKGGG